MKPTSRALTVITPVVPSQVPALRELLVRRWKDVDRVPLPDTHFTRFLVIEDPDYAGDRHGPLPPLLAWESNHDGRADAYLRAVATSHRALFDDIFAASPGYPGARDPAVFARWMRRRSLPHLTFYCGYRGVSKAEVDASREVHEAIRELLDRERANLIGLGAVEVEARIRAHLDARGLDLRPMHSDLWNLVDRGIAYAKLIRLAPELPKYWRWKRELARAQQGEPVDSFDRPVHGKPEAIAQEDFVRQNQLTHLVDLKPSRFRRWNLGLVMQMLEAYARGRFVHGDLGGITSIHFARWVLLEDPRDLPVGERRDRLLFFSNYDFSWDSYLGEFIDRAASGLTAVWSNTKGFPETEGLTGKGARDEERFKAWTRKHQLRTDLWWSGVPWSTVENVRDDVWIRRKLARPLTDEELPEWLRRL